MRTLAVLVLCLFGALPAGVLGTRSARGDDAEDAAAADIERRKRDLIFRLRVERAIASGASWLADRQQSDGSFEIDGNPMQGPFPQSRHRFGESALATLTLAHCGYPADHKVVRKAVTYLRKHYRSYMKGQYWPQASSYSLSIVVLALFELYATEPAEGEGEQVDRYGNRSRRQDNPCGYPKWAREMIERILD
ncbi:MAG: prenyltransferase/squalene oxidase repeat-containing protein, partial [Planctomycetota bacterium]